MILIESPSDWWLLRETHGGISCSSRWNLRRCHCDLLLWVLRFGHWLFYRLAEYNRLLTLQNDFNFILPHTHYQSLHLESESPQSRHALLVFLVTECLPAAFLSKPVASRGLKSIQVQRGTCPNTAQWAHGVQGKGAHGGVQGDRLWSCGPRGRVAPTPKYQVVFCISLDVLHFVSIVSTE